MNNSKSTASHVVAGLLTLAFLGAGGSKLAAMAPHPGQFEAWGYPIWFMYVTGLVEVAGAALVAVPKTRLWGALVLGATMLGALGTHVMAGEWSSLAAPTVLGSLSAAVLWLDARES